MERISPQPGPQEAFLRCTADVAFYGGSAGGGKTHALLLNPLYNIHNGRYGAVTFRRTTKQVKAEGGLWDEAEALYTKLGAIGNRADLFFSWPSGAKHSFAHMELERNRFDWQGAQIATIQFDELTHFTWRQFNYMLSRNRSTSGVPATMRATLNPDPDHWARRFIDWWIDDDGYAIQDRSGVIRWFVLYQDELYWGDTREELLEQFPKLIPSSFTFIRSSLEDNQILLQQDPGYKAKLMAMDRVERERLLGGNWNIRPAAGLFFQRSDFAVVDALPRMTRVVRAWDQAATEPDDTSDPDYTAGVKMGLGKDGLYYIMDVERFRANPSKVDARIESIASQDGKGVQIRLAQDPGSAGKSLAQSQTQMLAGYSVRAPKVSGDKQVRARPLASQVEAGNVRLLRGDWNETFLNELQAFPEAAHDDQVDAAADAFDELTRPVNRAGFW